MISFLLFFSSRISIALTLTINTEFFTRLKKKSVYGSYHAHGRRVIVLACYEHTADDDALREQSRLRLGEAKRRQQLTRPWKMVTMSRGKKTQNMSIPDRIVDPSLYLYRGSNDKKRTVASSNHALMVPAGLIVAFNEAQDRASTNDVPANRSPAAAAVAVAVANTNRNISLSRHAAPGNGVGQLGSSSRPGPGPGGAAGGGASRFKPPTQIEKGGFSLVGRPVVEEEPIVDNVRQQQLASDRKPSAGNTGPKSQLQPERSLECSRARIACRAAPACFSNCNFFVNFRSFL